MGDDEEAGKGLEWDEKDVGMKGIGRQEDRRKIEELGKERRGSTGYGGLF